MHDGPVGEIRVGLGSCCVALGSGKVHETICRTLAATGAAAVVKQVGCVGMCHQTPLVELIPPGGGPSKLFARVQAEDARAIVLSQYQPKSLWRRMAHRAAGWFDRFLSDETSDPVAERAIDVRDRPVCAFLGPQRHVATEYCGQIDPTDLDEYIRHDGFKALRHCLEDLSPEQIIEQVQASGLRGRGGAGFPTGQKWAAARAAAGEKKYVICNGDEGDPGAFMDRMLLESFPYRIIEGMAIAAKAVGADEGIFYIRAEYPLAVKRIREALHKLEDRGLLGDRVLSTDFRLHLSVKEGAGAFVCGEETALLASLEGRRGMPRLRPPYPAESGLWGRPTSVNNVETYAMVPWIFRNGAEAFARLGTEKSKGTKVFALAGKVVRGGLIEVPMGITVRQIVEEIGGGVAGGRTFKAVQIGGPSGGCVPAELADTPVDFEALSAGRRDHGLRRHGRPGRSRLHGRYGPLLPPLHAGPVVRQVYALPHRHAADARDPRSDLQRQGPKGRPGDARTTQPHRRGRQHLRAGPHRAQPGALHAALLPRGVRGPPGRPLSGGQVQGLDRLSRQRRLHRLHALRREVPGRRHPHDALRPAHDRHAEVYALRHLPAGLSGAGGLCGIMPHLTIDQREVEVPPGSTILDAAERLGIEIPTLCFSRQCEPSTSCLVCLVKLLPSGRMVPACATPVAEGMQVESETDEIHAVRRSTLELLLSDHLGDCVAPCSFGCPAQMNIPQMLRQIAAGELREALITVKADIALPAVLGRICPAPCEKVCRRGNLDGSVAICELKRIVADVDLASAEPYLPPCRPASGKRVAIVGGGPAGLAAAYYLAQGGHACTIFDDTDTLGGMFGREIPVEKLPRDVLATRDRPDPAAGH